jgi:hypothetical protein
MITEQEYLKYYDFIKAYTSGCDDAHDLHHLAAVCDDAKKIAKFISLPQEFDSLLLVCAMGHELMDTKQKCYDRESLRDELTQIFSDESVIECIIYVAETVSFSKACRWDDNANRTYKLIRTCVADADLLDGVGRSTESDDECIGLKRMLDYRKKNVALMNDKKRLFKEIDRHMNEKFRRVLSLNALQTDWARAEYVKRLAKLEKFIADYFLE